MKFQDATINRGYASPGQALAGYQESRDFKSAKIEGILKLKSLEFSGFFVTMFWTPWNALNFRPKIANNLFTFSALPSLYLLTERGQHTNTNTKYKKKHVKDGNITVVL